MEGVYMMHERWYMHPKLHSQHLKGRCHLQDLSPDRNKNEPSKSIMFGCELDSSGSKHNLTVGSRDNKNEPSSVTQDHKPLD
jgi:hypothetical protein